MDHVLIVEDHEENRNLLKMLLQATGWRRWPPRGATGPMPSFPTC